MNQVNYEGVSFNADYWKQKSESEFVQEILRYPHIFPDMSKASKGKALKRVYKLIKETVSKNQ